MLERNIAPMLACPSDPFDSPRHIFEIKWDGTRTTKSGHFRAPMFKRVLK